MKIRQATIQDVFALGELEKTQPRAAGWQQAGFETELTQRCAAIWVAEQEGQLVGFVALRAVEEVAEILNVAVAAGYTRQGIGRALLEKALFHLQQRGVKQVSLEVASDNIPAQALYAQAGFGVVGRRKQFYRSGADALILGKKL